MTTVVLRKGLSQGKVDANISAHNALATAHGLTANISAALAAAAAPSATNAYLTGKQTQPGAAQDVMLFEITPYDSPDHTLFTFGYGNMVFDSIVDPIMFWGYNARPTTGRVDATKPSGGWGIEGDYKEDSKRLIETYFRYVNAAGGGFRPLYMTIDALTDAATVDHYTDVFRILDPVPANPSTSPVIFEVIPSSVTVKGLSSGPSALYINAAAGKAAYLNLGYDTRQTALQVITGNYTWQTVFTDSSANTATITYGATFSGIASMPHMTIGTPSTAGHINIKPMHASAMAINIEAHASQAIGLMYFKVGSVYPFFVNKNALPIFATTAAPADADLAAGQMALWLDATNGAAKLMIKAKEAGGTVRTGSVALA